MEQPKSSADVIVPATIRLFMSGDVMLGRGIDQVLLPANDPGLYEISIRDARDYVRLARKAGAHIPDTVSCDYIWGDALAELNALDPDVRLINLETSVTRGGAPWRFKGIHYRLHPDNANCLVTAKIDISVLANNHMLDWGYEGLRETLSTFKRFALGYAGAGEDALAAARPYVSEPEGGGRVLVFSYALTNSGVPQSWAARKNRPGINLLTGPMDESVDRVIQDIDTHRYPGDIIVVSIHWGDNWGYEIPSEQVTFAHRLIDEAGADLVHGHSSHHAKAFDVYKGHLIIYGSGDLLNDYEGIGGHEKYRPDLALMVFADIEPETGRLSHLVLTPVQIRDFSIRRATPADAEWLRALLSRESERFGLGFSLGGDNRLVADF